MNRKLFRVITVVLAVLIVGQLLNLALQIHSDVYHYSYDEDTLSLIHIYRLCQYAASGRIRA